MTTSMTASVTEPNETQESRPLPGPGYRAWVAPPASEAPSSWAALLDQRFGPGPCEWAMGPDGVLVPVPTSGNAAAEQTKRGALGVRLAALLRRRPAQ